MGHLFSFFAGAVGSITKVVSYLSTVWGVLITAVGLFSSIILGMVQEWPIVSKVNEFIQFVDGHITAISSSIAQFDNIARFIISFFALDSLATYFTTAFSATIGVLIFVFVSVITLLIPLFFAVLTLRGIMKLLQVFTGGFVDV